jgi:hypothetical protein
MKRVCTAVIPSPKLPGTVPLRRSKDAQLPPLAFASYSAHDGGAAALQVLCCIFRPCQLFVKFCRMLAVLQSHQRGPLCHRCRCHQLKMPVRSFALSQRFSCRIISHILISNELQALSLAPPDGMHYKVVGRTGMLTSARCILEAVFAAYCAALRCLHPTYDALLVFYSVSSFPSSARASFTSRSVTRRDTFRDAAPINQSVGAFP